MSPGQSKRPNFLIIVADGTHNVKRDRTEAVQTLAFRTWVVLAPRSGLRVHSHELRRRLTCQPNLDKLASTGLRFNNCDFPP